MANRENLFIYGGKLSANLYHHILVMPHGGVQQGATEGAGPGRYGNAYRLIEGPAGAEFGLPANWFYSSLFASDDGSILAIIGHTPTGGGWAFRWIDGKWSFEPGHPESRYSLVTRPVRGYEEFLKLRVMFSDMVDANRSPVS